jgi:hypothetical protein
VRTPSLNEFPVNLPGTCYLCGASNASGRKWYLDAGVDIDFVGTLYVCQDCFATLARATGEFFSQDQVDEFLGYQQDMVTEAELVIAKYEYVHTACQSVGINLDLILENYEISMRPPVEIEEETPVEKEVTEDGTGPDQLPFGDNQEPEPIGEPIDPDGGTIEPEIQPLVLFDGFSIKPVE